MLGVIGALAGVLFNLELELLALVLVATYSSVFIALALLALHFGPFWMPASVQQTTRFWQSGAVVCCIFLGVGAAVGYVSTGASVSSTNLAFLWQDLAATARVRLGSFAGVTHLLFFRIFVCETLGLNLYLFVGLVVALVLLSVRAT